MSAVPDPSFWSSRTVCVTGGAGFLGRATATLLEELGADVRVIRSAEHDLRVPEECDRALRGADVVIHLAAAVGGIGFNRRNPGPIAHDNLLMGANVFESARRNRVRKLVCACSVCAYPRATPVPFREESIWDGYPEESNAPYGLAKRMLLVLSEAYRRQHGLDACVPVLANLYGPGDNYDPEDSHVVAAMIQKYAAAVEREEDEVTLWGSGEPTREFLYVGDAARALALAAERYESPEPVNVGSGREVAIKELAGLIAGIVGYSGATRWDRSRPDGQRRRCLDISRARERMGFEAEVSLEEGLRRAIECFPGASDSAGPARREHRASMSAAEGPA